MSSNGSSSGSGSIPSGWRELSLGELGQWSGGGTPSKREPKYWDGGTIPWVSPKDMKSVSLTADDIQDRVTVLAVEETAARLVPANSVALVVRSGILEHTLPVALLTTEATVNQDLKVIIPGEDVDPEWLLISLLGHAERIRRTCQKDGTTVASIEVPRLLEYRVQVPPPEEQNAVVATARRLLTDVEAGEAEIEAADRGLGRMRAAVLAAAVTGQLTVAPSGASADEWLEEILQRRRDDWERRERQRLRAVGNAPTNDRWKERYKSPAEPRALPDIQLPPGWTWATVDQLSTIVQYGSSTKTTENDSGVPVLRMGNIVDGRLDLSSLKYLPADHDEFPDLLLSIGDVLFNRTNSAELVGKAAIYRGEPYPCSLASYLIRVRLVEGVRPELIVHFLSSALGRAWVRSVVSQQVGQANVNGTKLKSLALPLPPREVQDEVCDAAETQLAVVDDGRRSLATARRQAVTLRRAILERAASGEFPGMRGSEDARRGSTSP